MRIPAIKTLRAELGRSQKEMADLPGISKKAVQSYEQGWRKTPPHVEQAILLHAILRRHADLRRIPFCRQLNRCPAKTRRDCPSARLRTPGFCWMLTGTLCCGQPTGSWAAKRTRCFQCEVMKRLLEPGA